MPWQLKYCCLHRRDHYIQQFEPVVLSQKTGQFFSEETMENRKPPAIITSIFPITQEQFSLGKAVMQSMPAECPI